MKSERFLCDPDISNNRSVAKPKYKNALKKVVMISKIHTFLSDRTFCAICWRSAIELCVWESYAPATFSQKLPEMV